MFLSDRDLRWAIAQGDLIVTESPGKPCLIGPTSIDLRLDSADQAKVWDIEAFKKHNKKHGHGDVPELHIGSFDYKAFAGDFQKPPVVVKPGTTTEELVFRRGDEIIVRPRGFVLWQTKEKVGTPEEGSRYICFVDGKSTKARTGVVVHMTAPTIHAAWGAWNVTLEIGNFGPFDIVLQEDDVIAQITVAMISSVPDQTMKAAKSATVGQANVGIQPTG
jgi:deoxycytidine triphosphate deaminase